MNLLNKLKMLIVVAASLYVSASQALVIAEIEQLSAKTNFPEELNREGSCLANLEFSPTIEIITTARNYKQYICNVPLKFRDTNNNILEGSREAKYLFKTQVTKRDNYRPIRETYKNLGSGNRVIYPIPFKIYNSYDGISTADEEAQIHSQTLDMAPTNENLIKASEHACKVIMLEALGDDFCSESDKQNLMEHVLREEI